MHSNRLLTLVLSLTIALTASTAHAHFLWWETPAGQAPHLVYGEFEHDVREKSPGRLDSIPGPIASSRTPASPSAPTPLHLRRGPDGFAIEAAAANPDPKAELFATETAIEVKDWRSYGLGLAKPMYYARFAPSWPADGAPADSMTLDVVPQQNGHVRILFRGAPAPKAKVTVHAPNGWSKELDVDDTGTTERPVPTPWTGTYVVEVALAESAPGEFSGTAYENVRHRATLAFTKP
jgi:hypothetical protein